MSLVTAVRPAPEEHAAYYGKYIALVPEDEAVPALERQGEVMRGFLGGLNEAQGALRYAPEKWSVKQVLGHVADAERVFAYRALRFARADQTSLPGFDENDYVAHARFDDQRLAELVEQLDAVRRGTLALFRGLEDGAWARRGDANGSPFSVRALAFIIAGHGYHHMSVIQQRYLGAGASATRP